MSISFITCLSFELGEREQVLRETVHRISSLPTRARCGRTLAGTALPNGVSIPRRAKCMPRSSAGVRMTHPHRSQGSWRVWVDLPPHRVAGCRFAKPKWSIALCAFEGVSDFKDRLGTAAPDEEQGDVLSRNRARAGAREDQRPGLRFHH